ncbi:MAG: hypothetical protein H6706_25560 [Myxococcales bacterium]|nr:hypothetical protein [Myxococcales bacterium]
MVGRGLVRDFVRRGGENAFVEHLAALLRVPALAEVFVTHVTGAAPPPGGFQVETQVREVHTRARPDIVLTGSTTTIWIEAKLDAGLTEKQPVVYLEALRREGPGRGHLVILAGSGRWGELARKLRDRVGHPPGHERTFVDRGVPVTQVTWREVRDAFANRRLDDPVAAYLQAEFIAAIDDHVERKAIPLNAEMIPVLNNPTVLRALAALEDVLLDLQEILQATGFSTGDQEAAELRQTGFYAWPAGDEDRMVWVGLIARAGAIWPGRGPVWVWIYGDAFDDEERLRTAGFEVIDPGRKLPDWADCSLVPLSLAGETSAEVVAGLGTQLRRIWDSAAGTGGMFDQ